MFQGSTQRVQKSIWIERTVTCRAAHGTSLKHGFPLESTAGGTCRCQASVVFYWFSLGGLTSKSFKVIFKKMRKNLDFWHVFVFYLLHPWNTFGVYSKTTLQDIETLTVTVREWICRKLWAHTVSVASSGFIIVVTPLLKVQKSMVFTKKRAFPDFKTSVAQVSELRFFSSPAAPALCAFLASSKACSSWGSISSLGVLPKLLFANIDIFFRVIPCYKYLVKNDQKISNHFSN